jgi:RimJ/RimL family protein N-acetyltransferase
MPDPSLARALPLRRPNTSVRLLRPSDLDAFLACRRDPLVGRYQGWSPMSESEAVAFLSEMAAVAHLIPGDWVQLGIAAPRSDHLIGDLGLFLESDGREAEIGFSLSREHQGRGHATEAVSAAVALLFAQSPAARVRAVTDSRNTSAHRVLKRVGFIRTTEREVDFRGEHCSEYVFSIARDGV